MPEIYQNYICYSVNKLSELSSGIVRVANITQTGHKGIAAG
jgi:hypothetical protein